MTPLRYREIPILSWGYTSDFLLALVMRFLWKLSRGQRAVKIARVATLAQVKKSQKKKKSREIQRVGKSTGLPWESSNPGRTNTQSL